jgi:hypothetical protein
MFIKLNKQCKRVILYNNILVLSVYRMAQVEDVKGVVMLNDLNNNG